MSAVLMFRPLVEWVYRLCGKAPEAPQYVRMTDERRYWIERAYPGGQ